MPDDPLDDIMGLLGLGSNPVPPGEEKGVNTLSRSPKQEDAASDEFRIAVWGAYSLWQAGNNDAEWIEIRGPTAVLRATRPKVQLLVSRRSLLQSWADGANPEKQSPDLSITTVMRFGEQQLELRHRTWRPIRVSRPQARAVLAFMDQIADFADL